MLGKILLDFLNIFFLVSSLKEQQVLQEHGAGPLMISLDTLLPTLWAKGP